MSAPEHRGDATDRIPQAAIPGPQKLVLAGYLRHLPSDRKPADGTAWPSIDLLCCYTSNGAKATARHRAALVASGVLVVVRIRPGNVPECRIDFDALAAAGCSERGASVDPGKRADHFGRDDRSSFGHDGGSAITPDAPTRQNRFGHDDGSGSAMTADEPSPRTLSKNPLQSLSTSGKPKPDRPDLKATWDAIQAIRKQHNPGSRGQALTEARRRNLRARMSELRKAGHDPAEALTNAAEWVHTSENMRAEGARKTGDPVSTMLRARHCVEYVELALSEASGATATSTTKPDGAPQAWRHVLTFTQRGELAERINTGRLGPDPDEHGRRLAAVKAAGGFPAFRMLDQYTERRVRDAFVAAYNGGAA